MNLVTILNALKGLDAATASLPAIKQLVDAGIGLLTDPADQATAKEAYADVIADNDDGHKRLQDKLAEAAKR